MYGSIYGRTRKPNYSDDENRVLLEKLELHKNVLFSKGQMAGGRGPKHQLTMRIWSEIADAVNALPNSTGRTIEELRHRWKDMSHKVRSAVRKLHMSSPLDKPVPKPYPLYFDKIIKIMGEEGNEWFSGFDEYVVPSYVSSKTEQVDTQDIKPDISSMSNSAASERDEDSNFQSNQSDGDEISQSVDTNADILNLTNKTPANTFLPCKSEIAPESLQMDVHIPVIPVRQKSQNLKRKSSPRPSLDGSTSSRRSPKSHRQMESMVLDPSTETVLQYNHFQTPNDSDETEDGDTVSSEHDGVVGENPTMSSDTLSVQDLKRKYYLEKISLIQQKSAFYRLQESKLRLELELLQRQMMFASAATQHHSGQRSPFFQPQTVPNHQSHQYIVPSVIPNVEATCPSSVPRNISVSLDSLLHHEEGGIPVPPDCGGVVSETLPKNNNSKDNSNFKGNSSSNGVMTISQEQVLKADRLSSKVSSARAGTVSTKKVLSCGSSQEKKMCNKTDEAIKNSLSHDIDSDSEKKCNEVDDTSTTGSET